MTSTSSLTFGRFKGVPLKDVPKWYFEWCKETFGRFAPNKRTLEQKSLLKYIDSCQGTQR